MHKNCFKVAVAAVAMTVGLLLTACGTDLGNLTQPEIPNPLAELETPFGIEVEGDLSGGFWLTGGYLYYFDFPSAAVKAVNLANPTEVSTALSVTGAALTAQGTPNIYCSIGERNGIGYFYLSREEASPDGESNYSHELYRVNSDQKKLETADRGETFFGDCAVIVEESQDSQATGNLILKTKDGTRRQIGDETLHYLPTYGWTENAPDSQVYLFEEEIVLFAGQPGGEEYQLCKVNLKTGRHTTLRKPFYNVGQDLQISGGCIYTVTERNQDGSGTMLQKITIADGASEEVPLKEPDSLSGGLFAVSEGTVYYQNGYDTGRPPMRAPAFEPTEEEKRAEAEEYQRILDKWSQRYIPDQELYRTGEDAPLLPGAAVNQIQRCGKYVICGFAEHTLAGEPSKISMLVFDETGEKVYESTDGAAYVHIEGNTLIYGLYEGNYSDWQGRFHTVRVVNLK